MNPYQTPQAMIEDLHKQSPIVAWARRYLLWLWSLVTAITLPLLLIETLSDTNALDDMLWLVFLLVSISGLVLGFNALLYYLFLYRPVKNLKTTSWRWWLIMGWVYLGLECAGTIWVADWNELDTVWGWVWMIVTYSEIIAIWYGAYYLRKPESMLQLQPAKEQSSA